MNLYELTERLLLLADGTEELDEEVLRDTLDSINESIEIKVENTAAVIRQIDFNVKNLKEEEERMYKRRKTLTNRAEYMKSYLQYQLERTGKERIAGDRFTVTIQNNPQSVRVSNEKALTTYLVEQPSKLDKKSLLDDLKSGMEIDGAELQQTRSIRIR